MIRKQYIAPAMTAVEMEEGAMLCKSGDVDGNFEKDEKDPEEGADMQSLPGSSFSVWNEW